MLWLHTPTLIAVTATKAAILFMLDYLGYSICSTIEVYIWGTYNGLSITCPFPFLSVVRAERGEYLFVVGGWGWPTWHSIALVQKPAEPPPPHLPLLDLGVLLIRCAVLGWPRHTHTHSDAVIQCGLCGPSALLPLFDRLEVATHAAACDVSVPTCCYGVGWVVVGRAHRAVVCSATVTHSPTTPPFCPSPCFLRKKLTTRQKIASRCCRVREQTVAQGGST